MTADREHLSLRGFILQPTYRIEAGKPVVHLWGRLETEQTFLVRDDRERLLEALLYADAVILALPAVVRRAVVFDAERDAHDREGLAGQRVEQLLCLLTLYLAGRAFALGAYFNLSLLVSAGLFGYQQYLIRSRERDACFRAFLHNNWVGIAVFVGIVLDYGV